MRPCTPAFDGTLPDRASLLTAVTNAVDGDVICLAAGSATYTTALDITAVGTKALEIRGYGALETPWGATASGGTILTNHLATQDILFFGYEVDSEYYPTVSNITFIADSSTGNSAYHIDISQNLGVWKPWIIHHNTFENFLSSANTLCGINSIGNNTGHAVIYRNKFYTRAWGTDTGSICNYGFTNTIVMQLFQLYNKIGSWQTPSTYGTADTDGTGNVYFETNYVQGHLISDHKESARLVARFNDISSGNFTDHGFDSGVTGSRHAEYYHNTFHCDSSQLVHDVSMTAWIGRRGGTGIVHNNSFPLTVDDCRFGGSSDIPPVFVLAYKLIQCNSIGGWPGSFPDTYPMAHQPGWGWIDGTTITAGPSTAQDQPGLHSGPDSPSGLTYDGYSQDLEPWLSFKNTDLGPGPIISVGETNNGECRAMSYTAQSKASDTKLEVPSASSQGDPYVSSGQDAAFFFADVIGGTTPTIDDSCGQTWDPRQGGTNSGLRLMAWTAHFNTSCAPVITITHDSSSAARVGTLVVMRGLDPSPAHQNPTVVNDSSNPYTGPSSGTLEAEELVLGYFAQTAPITDSITPGSGWTEAASCLQCASHTGAGFQGTTGGSDVSLLVVYKSNTGSTAAVQPEVQNTTSTSATGIGGVITFKVNGSAAGISPLDLTSTDFIVEGTEYLQENDTFDGSSGTGYGDRIDRPSSCAEGVVYWSEDQGSWNTENGTSGMPGYGLGQGVLDKCTAPNTWTDAFYVPYIYPHPLATEGGEEVTPEPPSTHHRALLTF